MKSAIIPMDLSIDFMPTLNHPLVQAYVSEDIELTEIHVQCIYDAIAYANKVMYGNDD